MSKTLTNRTRPKWLTYLLVVVLTAAVVAPAAVFAADKFTDVPASNTFHADISWLANAGVTKGCNPPTNTLYCPDDNVSRGQMAAFLRRFAQYLGAEDGTPAQADNATTVGGKTAGDLADADTVGGKTAGDLGTAAYSTFKDGPTTTSAGNRTVLTLNMPAGTYVIFAKAWLQSTSGVLLTGRCILDTGFDFDRSSTSLDSSESAALSLNVVRTFTTAASVVLTCDETNSNANIKVYDAKITAIEVTSLSNVGG